MSTQLRKYIDRGKINLFIGIRCKDSNNFSRDILIDRVFQVYINFSLILIISGVLVLLVPR